MPSPSQSPPLTLGARVTLACLWEATAPKPGNVYRGADFADMSYADFLASAAAIGSLFENPAQRSVGELTLDAVRITQQTVGANTNLGAVLLLAPLAKASCQGNLRQEIRKVAQATTIEDARLAYQAIRLAAPGGLGNADHADVASQPEIPLHEAMALAADRDLVARQFGNGFADVFTVTDTILDHIEQGKSLADAIVWAFLEQMGRQPDSLIARKCGESVAHDSAARAARTLDLVNNEGEDFGAAAAELDFWLRADGNRRNPGTTADLIAAALFVLLCEEKLCWPMKFYAAQQVRPTGVGR